MKKRLLALLLSSIMLLSLLPTMVFATGTTYTITNGTPKSEAEKNHGYITIDKTSAVKGENVEVTVIPNNGYQLKNLTYAPSPTTVVDILPEGFPIAESDVSGAPASAWKSATLDQLCYISTDSSNLFFYKETGNPDKSYSINTDTVLTINEDGNYIYTNGDTITITFSMTGEDGALNSIVFANTENTTWNGTYQSSACVAAGTMVTMYNGEQKAIENLEIGDFIRTFDHKNGEVSSAPVCFIWKSKNAANAFSLTFEGGITVTVIEEHGFYEYETNKYVFINVRNAKNYIGHHFYNADNNTWLALKDIEVLQNQIDAYAIATSKHLNHLSNGLLSMCDGTFERIANIFAYDDEMKYDPYLKKKDIKNYGLTSLEEIIKYEGFNEADFYDYNLQYLNIALGKGLVSPEWIESLSEFCAINNIYDSFPESKTIDEDKTLKMSPMYLSAPKKMLGTTSDSDNIEIKADAQGKYIFAMPAQNIIVTAIFEEIPVHTHNLVKVDGQIATETTSGWKEYYECKDSEDACHKYFEDATGLIPIDELLAWKAVDGNGYISPLVHSITPINGQNATDTEPGYKSYYACKNCGKYYEDATGLVEIPNIDIWKAEGGNGYLPKLEKEPSTPETGDNSHMTLWLMLLALSSIGICSCIIYGKKRNFER